MYVEHSSQDSKFLIVENLIATASGTSKFLSKNNVVLLIIRIDVGVVGSIELF
jgi:hypothetical protein